MDAALSIFLVFFYLPCLSALLLAKLNDPKLTSLLRKGEETYGNDSVPIPMIQTDRSLLKTSSNSS